MNNEDYPKVYLYRRLVQAKFFIDLHFAENIDLNNIAGEACFSKFHFIRRFRDIYGKTPHQYLILVRVEAARKLLNAAVPVTEVCYAVGFESLSSFSRLFKRVCGLNPSAYLLQQQLLKKQIAHSPLTFIPGCFAQKRGWI